MNWEWNFVACSKLLPISYSFYTPWWFQKMGIKNIKSTTLISRLSFTCPIIITSDLLTFPYEQTRRHPSSFTLLWVWVSPSCQFFIWLSIRKKKKKGNLGYSFCLVVGTEGNEQKMKLFYFSFLIVLIIKRMEFFFVLLLKEIGWKKTIACILFHILVVNQNHAHTWTENKEKHKIFNMIWLSMWSLCPWSTPTFNNPLIKRKEGL